MAGPVDAVLESLGGRTAIEQLHSLATEADCDGPEGAFITRVESRRPGLVHFRQTGDGFQTEVWSTPTRTWTETPEGERDLSDSVRLFVRSHEFHLTLIEFDLRFSNVQSVGGLRLNATDESGQPAVLTVDDNHLPVALETNPAGAEGPVAVIFEDWHEIDGLKYFRSFRLTEGPDRVFTYRFGDIVPNGDVPDLFD